MAKTCVMTVCLLLTLGAAAQQRVPAAAAPASGGSLPDAPSASRTVHPSETEPYVPLTKGEKFTRWVHHTYSPYLLISTTLSAGWAQAMGYWPTYGGGMEGYGKRFGATLADNEAAGFFKLFLLPTMLHQDPRYFHSGKARVLPRMGYAASRVLITRDDAGDHTFNTSEVVGTLLVSSVTNAYYPRRDRGFGETASSFGGALFSDAGSNLLREFWPDIRRVLRRHEPARMKKMEQQMPAIQKVEKIAIPSEN